MRKRKRPMSIKTIRGAAYRAKALNFQRDALRESWRCARELQTLLRPYLLPLWLRDKRPDPTDCLRRLAADLVRSAHGTGGLRSKELWETVQLTAKAEQVLMAQLTPLRGQRMTSTQREATYRRALTEAGMSVGHLPKMLNTLPHVPKRGLTDAIRRVIADAEHCKPDTLARRVRAVAKLEAQRSRLDLPQLRRMFIAETKRRIRETEEGRLLALETRAAWQLRRSSRASLVALAQKRAVLMTR